ncbi:MAG TPA: cytochrome P450 [Acidimicrobiales bacterium]|nr:cytochrome P450 [Acidimicrobiales bacterium]
MSRTAVSKPPVRVEGGVVTVAGFDECVQVLRDGDTFSSGIYEPLMGAVMGRTMLQMDEPEHRAHRALVSPAFRSRALDENLVRAVVGDLVDRFAGRGRATLVRELTFDFPVQVIARILGLPVGDYPEFRRWAVDLIGVADDWDRALAASAALSDYFAGILDQRRRRPRADLISELAGQGLADQEVFSFLRLLLPAGVETTYRASGTLLLALLADPVQLAAVRADRSLADQAFEEAIRWEPPVTVILRRATRDAEIGGVPMVEGTELMLLLGEANRDGRRYPDPDRFDLFRRDGPHVGFGFGVHACLGMHLARMEARVALNTLLDRLPDLRLGGPARMQGTAFRSPDALPIQFHSTELSRLPIAS